MTDLVKAIDQQAGCCCNGSTDDGTVISSDQGSSFVGGFDLRLTSVASRLNIVCRALES